MTGNDNSSILKIVFDTSAIFTESLTDLFSYQVTKLIGDFADQKGLAIEWYLPEIVLHERRYQLITGATELLHSIQKPARILGQKLEVNADTIKNRVEETINQTIAQTGIQINVLNYDRVEWDNLIQSAAYRRPPFEQGEREKGFRDAIVAENYMQILAASPEDPNICRVVLVTSDNLLAEAVKNRIHERANAHPPCRIGEVRSLINTLISEVNEAFINSIKDLAMDFFYRPGVDESLFYRENLQSKIRLKFNKELNEIPEGAERRVNQDWEVSPPQFLKKEEQSVIWVSQISLEHRAYNTAYFAPPSGSYYPSGTIVGSGTVSPWMISSSDYNSGTTLIDSTGTVIDTSGAISPYSGMSVEGLYVPAWLTRDNLVAIGQTIFEIEWSVIVTDENKFENPSIRDIRILQSLWH